MLRDGEVVNDETLELLARTYAAAQDAMTDEIEDQGDDATLPADEASPGGGPEAPAGAEDEDEADEREPEPGEPGPWSPDESVSTEGEAVASPEQDLTLLRGELDAAPRRTPRRAGTGPTPPPALRCCDWREATSGGRARPPW